MTQHSLVPSFRPERFFIKDASFETTDSLKFLFARPSNLNIKLDVQVDSGQLDGTSPPPPGTEVHETTIHTTLSAQTENGETVFLAEVVQSGVFILSHIPEKDVDYVLMVRAADFLFPYAAQELNHLVVKGGFDQISLPPYNFMALYDSKMAERKAEAAAESSGS